MHVLTKKKTSACIITLQNKEEKIRIPPRKLLCVLYPDLWLVYFGVKFIFIVFFRFTGDKNIIFYSSLLWLLSSFVILLITRAEKRKCVWKMGERCGQSNHIKIWERPPIIDAERFFITPLQHPFPWIKYYTHQIIFISR